MFVVAGAGRGDGTALGVTHDDDQRGLEVSHRVFDRPEDSLVNDVAGVSDGEDVAELLVEDDLWGHSGVRATQHDSERLLAAGEGLAVGLVVAGALFLEQVTLVAALEELERLLAVGDELRGVAAHLQRVVSGVSSLGASAAHVGVECEVSQIAQMRRTAFLPGRI